jgi:hypothetical protein
VLFACAARDASGSDHRAAERIASKSGYSAQQKGDITADAASKNTGDLWLTH